MMRIVLFLFVLPGCFLFPTKDRDTRPVGEDLASQDLHMADLFTPDLFTHDLFMPDLRPECMSEADCTGTLAGMACVSMKCQPCTLHAQCASQTCDPYQTVKDRMGGADVPGRCVPATEVVYVDNKNGGACTSGDGNTPGAGAMCTLQEGINALVGAKKSVRVMTSTVPYTKITATNKVGTIYGPASDGDKAQVGNDLNNDAVTISGTADITLYGVEIFKGANGINCSGATASVKLRRGRVTQSAAAGALVNACKLEIDRSLFDNNSRSALKVTGVIGYVITNNFFVNNTANNAAAVNFDATSTGAFRFNTVARNISNIQGGIDCSAAMRDFRDSIVFGNTPVMNTQFLGNCNLISTTVGAAENNGSAGAIKSDPTFVDATNNDFHLVDNAGNGTCCVDRATGTIPIDYFGASRPKGGACDTGAHELK